MDNLWLNALATLDADGTFLNSRNGNSKEYIGYLETLKDVDSNFLFNKIRHLSPYYACAEFLWYLSMTDDTTFLQLFAPSYERFCEDGVHAFGAYGHRWSINSGPLANDQLTDVIEVLRRHPETRQAVVTMWDGSDLDHARDLDKKDLPCTLTHQFLLRDGYLNMITTMRSNDVWLGMPYDVFCNTQLMKLIADILGLAPGIYIHSVGSLHFYERDFEKIDQILSSERSKQIFNTPQSRHRIGGSRLNWKSQVELAIQWVQECAESEITLTENATVTLLLDCHSIIADAAFVCASRWDKKYIEFVFDPQLRKAVELYHEQK